MLQGKNSITTLHSKGCPILNQFAHQPEIVGVISDDELVGTVGDVDGALFGQHRAKLFSQFPAWTFLRGKI